MKKLALILFLISINPLEAQILQKSDFLKNDWYFDQDTLAVIDTLNLIKVVGFKTENKNVNKNHIVYFYLKEISSRIEFKEKDTLYFGREHLLPCGFVYRPYLAKWEYDKDKQTLKLFSKRFSYTFKIIGRQEKHTEILTKFGKDDVEFEADLSIVKLLRIR